MKISTVISAVSAALVAVSCMNNGSFKSSYNDYFPFESDYLSNYTSDSLYFKGDFIQSSAGQTLIFHGKRAVEDIEDVADFKGGFMLSLLRDTLVEEGHLAKGIYRSTYATVADTTGADNSKGFAIFRYNPGNMPEHCVTFPHTAYGSCRPQLVSVCNTNLVANAVKYGYGSCRAFQPGDYMKLVITSVLNGYPSANVEIMLAEYTDSGLNMIDSWKRFDLTKLGDFDYLEFSILSNVDDVPLYCCIDGMVVSVDLEG